MFNEAIKYLGKYPATKKKLKNILKKKIKNKKIYKKAIFPDDIDKNILIKMLSIN